jgi:hypothetical protein
LHQVGDLFELNVKLRCQKVNGAGSTGNIFNSFTSASSKGQQTMEYEETMDQIQMVQNGKSSSR